MTATIEPLERSAPIPARLRNMLYKWPILSPLAVLAVTIVVFSFLSEAFFSAANLSLITQQVMVIGMAALGQTLIILTAGIDLSVGSIAVLASMVMGVAASSWGVPAFVSIALGLAVGLSCGLLNGLLVVHLGLPPFIATLGSLSIFLALGLAITSGSAIRGRDMPELLTAAGRSVEIFGTNVAIGTIVLLITTAFLVYVLSKTSWGRHVYAVGDDPEAARLSGIRSPKVVLSVYVVAGLLYGIAAWLLTGRMGSASPQAASLLNLDSITAVVIGGTSLFGGRGLILGSLLGAVIVGVFRNGLALAGVQALWQDFAVGALIICAVFLDQWIRKAK